MIDEYIVDATDYVGLGSGAFSYVDGAVYSTTFSLDEYAARVASGQTGITGARHLGPRERMRYDLLVRLFALSMDKAWARARYGDAFERTLAPELTAFRAMGAITEDDAGWRLTRFGRFVWVKMMSAFFESVNRFREQMRARLQHELEDEPIDVPVEKLLHGAR